MDPVVLFVDRALDVVNHLDYVAKCCQTCDREFADTLVGSELESFRLRRLFDDLVPHLRRLGIEGAFPTSVARLAQVDIDRIIDGLQIARDYRSWWDMRPFILDAIEHLHRESPSVPSVVPNAAPPASPALPGEVPTAASKTPSVHDIAVSLTDRQRDVLFALLESEAFDRPSRLPGAELCQRAGVNPEQLRRVMASERCATPARVMSERNRRGGYWLTAHGTEVARDFMTG